MSKKVKFPNITWEEIRETKAGVYYIQPNWFLESGRELASYIPDLETNYHYALNLPDILDKKVFGENLVEKLSNNGKWIGISCASYRGSVSWKTWNLNHWLALADYLISDGYKLCLLGGKWDDLTDSLADQLPRENVLNLVGKTDFGEACSVHKLLPFYIGFSSGLGIIRTVLDLPTLMLWPCNESINQQALSMSWADPKDIESKKYIARAYMEPRVIFNVFKTQSEIFKEME
jgi:ADP-heptose:LPS heptosyltransferase